VAGRVLEYGEATLRQLTFSADDKARRKGRAGSTQLDLHNPQTLFILPWVPFLN
jgi:hypothetical protein